MKFARRSDGAGLAHCKRRDGAVRSLSADLTFPPHSPGIHPEFSGSPELDLRVNLPSEEDFPAVFQCASTTGGMILSSSFPFGIETTWYEVVDLFCGGGGMNELIRLIEVIGTLDLKVVALLVLALAIVAVIIIIGSGLGR